MQTPVISNKRKAQMRAWAKANRGKQKEYARRWRLKHYRECRAREDRYKELNKDKVRAKDRKRRNYRYQHDTAFRLKTVFRTRILRALRREGCKRYPKAAKSRDLLGCSVDSFKIYIESKFETGMNWQNFGQWHLDHIMPCAIFDLSRADHQKRCFHFSNYQPMWAADNIRKSDKIINPQFNLL